MVLEFIRDNAVEGTENLAKRERVVLCTDDAQDFQIWQQFVESYRCAADRLDRLEGERVVGRSRKKKRRDSVVDRHDETTSEDLGAQEETERQRCGPSRRDNK
ncbi:hypothetical protein DQ04_10901020 [Trypanosoma grayi]|uniref:hypothetical protein n=1 Tax=Trypanosoma grayi TaxID=71804 RepID=UPI0004F492A4|nr:hypothetical protein DQ04_10901020 [Trypanosoma grayi]KEG07106.1 hypothetical protein DQ04_10901020 [Trypanosoma grayi]